MTITLETIISAACTEVEAVPTAVNTQKIFLIKNPKEAKLTFDLLVAYGFDAKLYNENRTSKLYVTVPKPKQMENTEALNEAASYGAALKTLQQHIDRMATDNGLNASDYSLTFSTTPSLDKQILIHMTSSNRNAASIKVSPVASPSQPAAAKSQAAATPVMASRMRFQQQPEDMFSGPEIMRQPGMHRANMMKTDGPDSFWKQFKLYMRGNSMSATMTLIGCVIGLIIFISLFVVSKALLCPDFATLKNEHPPWFCTYRTDDEK